MQALLFDGQLRLANDYPEPVQLPGEALIRPSLVGICNTDIEITRGYMGFRGVLGHEFVGVVAKCEERGWVGRRVVGEINAACGRCAVCARGDKSHCPERTTLGIERRDGVMGQLFNLPTACLHEVPAGVPDEEAVFAEPLAAALEILEQSHIRPTDRVAVVGDGKLGLLCAQVLRLPGCEVVVVGRHPERWEFLQALGIEVAHVNEAGQGDKETRRQGDKEIRDMMSISGLLSPLSPSPLLPFSLSQQFDVVVDCTGQPGGLTLARGLVRSRGRLVLKSTFAAASVLNLNTLVVDEVQLLGSRCGPFAAALRLLERGLAQVQPLIAGRFPLRDGLKAFRAADHQLKILLEI